MTLPDAKLLANRIKGFLASPTARLAASYLLVIMVMSLSFSIVSYNTSSRALGRQIPPPSLFDDNGDQPDGRFGGSPRVNAYISQRIDEGRQMLLGRFILVNILVLVAGSVLSYYLARRTLKPIEDSMQAQAQFISDASHELRTPLTALQTTNEVALRNTKLDVKGARDVLKDNIEEVSKLKALTDGLLRLAHYDEAGQTAHSFEPVSLQDIASEAMNRIMSAALEKDIAVEDETGPVMVVADRQGLVQVLVVLLDNAVKYSPERSLIKVKAVKKAKQAILSVEDQGPGIRPYDLRKIFDRFYRADQSRSTRHVPGNGIGLALAKKIIEQHDGEISVQSALGKGSTFTIKLPA